MSQAQLTATFAAEGDGPTRCKVISSERFQTDEANGSRGRIGSGIGVWRDLNLSPT